MNLYFDRGDSTSPVGHALIYFQGDDGSILATYVSVPPIKFDLSSYMPGFLATAMQGMDLGDAMVAAPMPPIPEQVAGLEYLRALAEQRRDDLVFAGATIRGDPMRMAGETAEAARLYGEMYGAVAEISVATTPPPARGEVETDRFATMSQQEQINELNSLTGRLLDSIKSGSPDSEVEREMRVLASVMPRKYRVEELIQAVRQPGQQGQRLAELYMERCYKLFNEDYLDLERIDREIEAAHG